MKKILTGTFIFFLLTLGFTMAYFEDEKYSSEEMKLYGSHTESNADYIGTSYLNYEVTVNVKKGWNLLPGVSILDIQPSSEIKQEDIYNYIYNKGDGKYIQIKDADSFSDDILNILGVSQKSYPYFVGQSTWVYSKKDGLLSYKAVMFPKNPILTKGWNFVSVTPYLVFSTNSEEEFLGTCKDKIIKSYGYDSDSKEWISLRNDELDSLHHGAGGAIKVSEDCTLGQSKSGNVELPKLPN